MSKENKTTLKQRKLFAKDIYLTTEMSQKEIAQIVGVSEVTLSKWAAGSDKEASWETTKRLRSASKQAAESNLYKALVELTTDPKEAKNNADAIAKVTKSIETITDNRVTIPNKIEAFMDFINWLRKQPGVGLDEIQGINKKQHEYIQDLINHATNS